MREKNLKYDYSDVFQCFKFYEYMYQCAEKELNLNNNTALVSDRSERLVIEYPDKFIEKYFPASYDFSSEDIREMLYGILRYERLSILMWTDDNRSCSGAGKDTIHIIKPDSFSKRTPIEEIKFLLEQVENKKLFQERLRNEA